MRSTLLACAAALLVMGVSACGGGDQSSPAPPPTAAATRTWRLGFSPIPPRPTTVAVLDGIDRWSQRAEIAAIHEELPWTDLLGGMSPDDILDRDKVQLVNYMRGKGLQLYFMADLTDGLSRGDEAPQLRALGRSITEPAVQQAYRNYMLAVQRKLHPEIIGLAAETNLIRVAALPAVYAAVVTAANAAAADLRAAGSPATLAFSVQVETAWGRTRRQRQLRRRRNRFHRFSVRATARPVLVSVLWLTRNRKTSRPITTAGCSMGALCR